jgi:hypothetical protein
VLHGEFDIATIDVLASALREVCDRTPTRITVDLHDASFFGLAGCHAPPATIRDRKASTAASDVGSARRQPDLEPSAAR